MLESVITLTVHLLFQGDDDLSSISGMSGMSCVSGAPQMPSAELAYVGSQGCIWGGGGGVIAPPPLRILRNLNFSFNRWNFITTKCL